MLKTPNQRLQHIRVAEGKDQTAMAGIMLIKQSAYSRKEKGERKITASEAKLIEDNLGYRAMWLLFGDGDMCVPGKDISMLQEPDVAYNKIPENEVEFASMHFRKQITQYKKLNRITERECATTLHLNAQLLNNVMHGHKSISLNMLLNSFRYGNFNLHYTAGGKGEMFNSKEQNHDVLGTVIETNAETIKGLRNRITELEELTKTQKLLIEALSSNQQGKKRA